MKRLAFCSLALTSACFGGERATNGACPAGETCSPLTPRGLQFMGATLIDDANLAGPAPTAIGGTQDIQLQYDPNAPGHYVPLDLDYIADDDGGLGVAVDHTAGATVSVRGVASRTNYLRIADSGTGELFDRKQLTGAAIDSFALVAGTTELTPVGAQLAFAAGDVKVGIALYGSVQEDTGPTVERLVDQSMHLGLQGATQRTWDSIELTSAIAGTNPLAVTAGNRPSANVDVVVVDHLDQLVQDASNPATIAPNGSALVCFDGMASGRYVAGLTWHFLVDNVDQSLAALGNCVAISTQKVAGSITVVGSADGMSASTTLAVGTATRTSPHPARVVRTAPATAGDRAAM
jgi:hypothetical protein